MNRFGVILKSNQLGKWGLIVDLSHLEGESVTDGIPVNAPSMQSTYKVRQQLAENITTGGDGGGRLRRECLKHSTIKVYLLAFRYLQITAGFLDPFAKISWLKLDYVMTGIKKDQAKKGVQSRPCIPITPVIMRKLKAVWEKSADSRDTKLLWAACCLCFFGFLRCREMTVPADTAHDSAVHLSVSDITVDHPSNPAMVQVSIKASKTVPFRKGSICFQERLAMPSGGPLRYLKTVDFITTKICQSSETSTDSSWG